MAAEILFHEDQFPLHTQAVDIWSLGCMLFRLLTHQLPFPEFRHLQLCWRSKKPFLTNILIEHSVSGGGISLISEIMKSNPVDRMTVTTALLHSWVSIQEPTPPLGDPNSFKNNPEDEPDAKSANEGSATENRECISANISKSNLKDNKPFSNAAITPHTRDYKMHSNATTGVIESVPDSGYSSVVDKLRKGQNTQEEPSTSTFTVQFPCNSSEMDALDIKTNYSDSACIATAPIGSFVTEFVDGLPKRVRSEKADPHSTERLFKALPQLLQSFAFKVGHQATGREQLEVMVFVSISTECKWRLS